MLLQSTRQYEKNNKILRYTSFLFKGSDGDNDVTILCFPFKVFKEFTIFRKLNMNAVRCTDRWGYDQVRLHFVICQVAFPLTSFSCLHLKTIVQLQKCRLRDVNASVTKDTGRSDNLNGGLLYRQPVNTVTARALISIASRRIQEFSGQ